MAHPSHRLLYLLSTGIRRSRPGHPLEEAEAADNTARQLAEAHLEQEYGGWTRVFTDCLVRQAGDSSTAAAVIPTPVSSQWTGCFTTPPASPPNSRPPMLPFRLSWPSAARAARSSQSTRRVPWPSVTISRPDCCKRDRRRTWLWRSAGRENIGWPSSGFPVVVAFPETM